MKKLVVRIRFGSALKICIDKETYRWNHEIFPFPFPSGFPSFFIEILTFFLLIFKRKKWGLRLSSQVANPRNLARVPFISWSASKYGEEWSHMTYPSGNIKAWVIFSTGIFFRIRFRSTYARKLDYSIPVQRSLMTIFIRDRWPSPASVQGTVS